MAEWRYEAGIGEARAALVENGVLVAARIEPADDALRVGTVLAVRVIERNGTRGIVRAIASGHEGLIDPLPAAIEMGRAVIATVTRETIVEPGAVKRAKMRLTPDAITAPGSDLRARIAATGVRVRDIAAHGEDLLEAAGWSETLESAARGHVEFPGGALRISLTPAMTLIDVDGDLAPFPLAMAGAIAASAAIRCFDLGGSIGIDFPTVGGKADRLAIAAAIDAALAQPFERTAVNGFGFLQIVRPRLRASLCETLRFAAPAAAARALLRRAQRAGLVGAVTLVAPPPLMAVFAKHPEWIAALRKQCGGPVTLRTDAAVAMSAAYVNR